MNNKELLIDFIEYAKLRHVMPVLNSNIEPLVDDYLSSRNIGNTHVSGELNCDHDYLVDMYDHFGFAASRVCDNCGRREAI